MTKLLFLVAFSASLQGAANIVVINLDPPGVGFNDSTVASPVGGNPGTTIGQQRLNVYQAVAAYWGSKLDSSVTIRVQATWEALNCTATTAVLGAAGPLSFYVDPVGDALPVPLHFYPKALTNKIIGEDANPNLNDIRARFNVNLGTPSCFTGTGFYLGLDNNHGNQVDFFSVLLHEIGHGLGFLTTTDGQTGAFLAGFPSIYDYFLLDTTLNLHWDEMSNAQRRFSALNSRKLGWDGVKVSAAVPLALASGVPQIRVTAPVGLVGDYLIGTAAFGPPLSAANATGELMPVPTTTDGAACLPLSGVDAQAISGKIALIDRGVCAFTVKVKNAQNAGALGVVIADNQPATPPADLGGSDPSITIPAVIVSQADANAWKIFLQTRSRTRSGLFAVIGLNFALRAGADFQNRALVYNPNPFSPGSSISHYDTSAFPNQLMEPFISGDLTHTVDVPRDLTLQLLKDIGWD